MSRVEEGGVQKLFVPIPDVDRGRADFRSIKVVMEEEVEDCGNLGLKQVY